MKSPNKGRSVSSSEKIPPATLKLFSDPKKYLRDRGISLYIKENIVAYITKKLDYSLKFDWKFIEITISKENNMSQLLLSL